jgi:DegV family protein with EDD domain
MPFIIDGDEYFEGENLTQEEFYQRLAQNQDVSTSQPSIYVVKELWEEVLQTFDEIVYIPMSSALSKSCEAAQNAAEEYDGKVEVVDNKRISVTQKQSVFDALKLAQQGKSAKEIKEYLLQTAADSSIYIMVTTLKYLKKGGRITPAAALIAAILSIKPVLQIQGGKLDSYAKVMNEKAGRAKMIEAMKNDFDGRFADLAKEGKITLGIAYTNCLDKALAFKEEIENAFPGVKINFVDPLPLSIACHIGDGALAIASARVEE